MVPDRQGSVTNEEPTSSSDPGGSSLEGPTMVSNLAGDVVQLSAAASSVTKPNAAVRAQHDKKWLSWCSKRGCDPISGPISDFVSFLADLYTLSGIPDQFTEYLPICHF